MLRRRKPLGLVPVGVQRLLRDDGAGNRNPEEYSKLQPGLRVEIQRSGIVLQAGVNVTKLFVSEFEDFRNKLECLSLASRSSLVYCLWVLLGTYPIVDHLKGASFG